MCCDCQESMKSEVEIEMQGTVLFALLHLKITNVSLRQKVKTKNNYEVFQLRCLVETPTSKYTRSSVSLEALGRPGPEICCKVNGEGKFHVPDRVVCGLPGVR